MRKIVFGVILMLFVLLSLFAVQAAVSSSSSSSGSLDAVSAISISLVNQDPDPAIAGDIVEVRLGVENIGGVSATNLIIEMVPAYPFGLVTGQNATQKIGTINAYQKGENMKVVKYNLKVDRDATAGSYELKVRYYEEGSAVIPTKSLSMDVRNRESAEVIYIDKTNLVPGKLSDLRFTINNVGSAPLRDLTFYWENEDQIILPVGSDNTKYIKYIEIGDSAELQYQVIADTNADPGLYKLDLYLTYEDTLSGEEKEISTIAGVYVGGGTDFDIAFSESSSGQTSFSIANIGSNPAYSVSVIIPQQQGWSVSGSNSMIIGNLNKGDYTVASFSLQSTQAGIGTTDQDISMEELIAQRQNMQNQDSVKIQIAYTNTMGEREVVEKNVSVNTQAMMASSLNSDSTDTTSNSFGPRRNRPEFFSQYKWYIIVGVGIIVLVSGIFIYGRYKKEKKANPKFRFKDVFKLLKMPSLKNLFRRKK